MKLINDNKKTKTIDKLVAKLNATDKLILKIGSINWELPKEIFYNVIEKYSFFEADSIQDIKNNYSSITTVTKLFDANDEAILKDSFKNSVNISSFKEAMQLRKDLLEMKAGSDEYRKHVRLPSNDNLNNPNLVILDNVYLGDYNFGQTKWYEYCDMTIKDKFNNTISAMAVYRQKFIKQYVTLEEELSAAMSYKDYSTAFDITFMAMSDKQKVPILGGLSHKIVQYEPKLILNNITKTRGDNKDWFPVDIKTFVPCYS